MPMNPKDDALANENRMIIDTLKLELGIKTDAAAAKLVGITKDAMSMMKNGRIGVSIENRLAMMDLLNCSGIENLSKRITENYLCARIIETIGETVGENKSLIDLFKAHQGFKTDEEISQIIGLKRNSISMIRSGKSQLGPLPRLKMLSAVDGVSIDDVEKGLASKEWLLYLLKGKNIDSVEENNIDLKQYENQKNQQNEAKRLIKKHWYCLSYFGNDLSGKKTSASAYLGTAKPF